MTRYLLYLLLFTGLLSCSTTQKSGSEPTIDKEINKEAYFDPSANIEKLAEYTSPQLVDPSSVRVDYSVEARKGRIQGRIVLKLYIDEKGNVRKAEVEQSLDRRLDRNALETFKKAKFHPGTLNGEPVKSIHKVPIYYKLGQS